MGGRDLIAVPTCGSNSHWRSNTHIRRLFVFGTIYFQNMQREGKSLNVTIVYDVDASIILPPPALDLRRDSGKECSRHIPAQASVARTLSNSLWPCLGNMKERRTSTTSTPDGSGKKTTLTRREGQ